MSKYRILLALLLVASLACGLGGDNGDNGDAGNGNGGGGNGGGAGDAPSIDELAGLDSYRLRHSWEWIPDDGEPEGWEIEQEYTRDPAAQRMVVESGGETMEFVQIEDQAWSCFGGMCALTQDSGDDILSDMEMGLEDLGLQQSELDYIGRDTVNGISTKHYSVDFDLAALLVLTQGDVSDVEAEVWLADESGMPSFVVKYESSWQEDRDEGSGSFEISYEVYDINVPFTIEPPEGAAGWPEDIPSYPNATDVLVMENYISFATEDDLATVMSFYETGLAAAGWTMLDETDVVTAVMQTWVKGAKTLSITAAEDEGVTGVAFAIG